MKVKQIVIVLIVLSLAGGASFVGYTYVRNKRTSDQNKQAATTAQSTISNKSTEDKPIDGAATTPTSAVTTSEPSTVYGNCPSTSSAKTFYNKIIGLEFCYPAAWGEATIGEVEASASDAGGAYEIKFSSLGGLTVASKTVDWKNTVARGGRCEDPQDGGPQFSTYMPDWKLEKSGTEIFSALRVHIKNEPRYLIRELADTYFGAVCLMGVVATPGGAYDSQLVVFNKPLGERTIQQHVDNPEVLIDAAFRVQFGELVDSMKHTN